MKRIVMLVLAIALALTAIPSAFAASRFHDVPRNHWAYDAIMEMAERGIIKGYNDETFRPNNQITRAEFAKIMIAAAGIRLDDRHSLKQTFTDVDRDHWAFQHIELAKNYLTGYKSGSVYTYKPNQPAVREDIAVALVRLMGYDRTKKANLSKLDDFRDDHRISKALREYIAVAVETDLIRGFNDKTFRPHDPITRAEAASLLYRAKLDETKVVFPVEDKKPSQPSQPADTKVSHSDTFQGNKLDKWETSKATGTWFLHNGRVSAYSKNDDIDHYLLPLKWSQNKKVEDYEIEVDVQPYDTNGLGGLFFNGKDGKATVVYLSKETIYIAKMEDAKKKDLKAIAHAAYKLQKNNKLKIVVKDDDYSVYLNNHYIYGLENQDVDGTQLGLYLQKDASKRLPFGGTYFDQFSFKEID